jgi:hypothetical protein
MSMDDTTVVNTSKTEVVRVELKNQDFLKFNDLNGRLIFSDKDLNQRKSREETFKFSLRFTTLAIQTLLKDPNAGLFIQDNENQLLTRPQVHFITPTIEKNKKVEALLKSLTKVDSKADAETGDVAISRDEWAAIMEHVANIKDLAF